jgi:hypothetical protein
VVDRNVAIERSALIWAHSLIGLEGVDPASIFIHTVEPDLEVLGPLKALGTQIVPIERFGDGKHCNKLAQPLSPAEFDADVLIMNDCDIGYAGQFVPAISLEVARAFKRTPRIVMGKTVDFCNPPLERMAQLMDAFGLGPPSPLAHDTLVQEPMPEGYFNGGLYGLPVPLLEEIGIVWQSWATRLLESDEALGILEDYAWHIDQISFLFAVRELDIAVHRLDERFNFPIHTPHPLSRQHAIETPLAIHFHNNLGPDGLLGPSGVRVVDKAVAAINTYLEAHDLSLGRAYAPAKPFKAWHPVAKEFSMTTRNAAALRTILKAVGIENAASVIDVPCGTGRHLDGLNVSSYRGFDARADRLELARRRDLDATFLDGVPGESDTAALVLCLDFDGFAGAVGDSKAAAQRLASLAEDRLLVLDEPRNVPGWLVGEDTIDLAQLLEETGLFGEIIALGSFAGRTALLALVAGADTRPRIPPATAGTERLYAALAASCGVARDPGLVPVAAGEIDVLKRLPDHLDGDSIAILSGGANHDVFETVLEMRGALPGRLGEPERPEAQDTPLANADTLHDVVCVLPDVDPGEVDDPLIGALSARLRIGGLLFLAVPTEKRGLAVNPDANGTALSSDDVTLLVKGHGLLPVATRAIALPFEYDIDVMVIEAIRMEPPPDPVLPTLSESVPIVPPGKPSRTPDFLKRFERNVRRRVRGETPQE